MKVKCDNCDWKGDDSKGITPIPDLEMRVAPGDEYPACECPECGALCFTFVPKVNRKVALSTIRKERKSDRDPEGFIDLLIANLSDEGLANVADAIRRLG